MLRSYLLLLFCVCCWGSNFVFGTVLVQQFPPMLLSALRLSSTTLFLLAYAMSSKQLRPLRWKDCYWLVPMGFFGVYINQAAFFTGLQTVDATMAALITSLAPITVIFLAAAFLKEAMTLRMLLGAAIAIVGVAFVLGRVQDMQASLGIVLVLLAMLTYAVFMVMMRKVTDWIDAVSATLYSTAFGALMMVPTALAAEPLHQVSPHLWAWALLFATAFVMQGLCGVIWNAQLKKVGAGKAAVFINLQPFVAMVVGYAVLGTPVTWVQVFGAILIVGGVVMATSYKRRNADAPAPVRSER